MPSNCVVLLRKFLEPFHTGDALALASNCHTVLLTYLALDERPARPNFAHPSRRHVPPAAPRPPQATAVVNMASFSRSPDSQLTLHPILALHEAGLRYTLRAAHGAVVLASDRPPCNPVVVPVSLPGTQVGGRVSRQVWVARCPDYSHGFALAVHVRMHWESAPPRARAGCMASAPGCDVSTHCTW